MHLSSTVGHNLLNIDNCHLNDSTAFAPLRIQEVIPLVGIYIAKPCHWVGCAYGVGHEFGTLQTWGDFPGPKQTKPRTHTLMMAAQLQLCSKHQRLATILTSVIIISCVLSTFGRVTHLGFDTHLYFQISKLMGIENKTVHRTWLHITHQWPLITSHSFYDVAGDSVGGLRNQSHTL